MHTGNLNLPTIQSYSKCSRPNNFLSDLPECQDYAQMSKWKSVEVYMGLSGPRFLLMEDISDVELCLTRCDEDRFCLHVYFDKEDLVCYLEILGYFGPAIEVEQTLFKKYSRHCVCELDVLFELIKRLVTVTFLSHKYLYFWCSNQIFMGSFFCAVCNRNVSTFSNTKLEENILWVGTLPLLQECRTRCYNLPSCMSLGYIDDTCTLHSSIGDPDTLINVPNSVYEESTCAGRNQ